MLPIIITLWIAVGLARREFVICAFVFSHKETYFSVFFNNLFQKLAIRSVFFRNGKIMPVWD